MRGGKGKAGGRKHFWIRTVKYEPDRFKSVGFKPPSSLEPESVTINIGDLENLALNKLGMEVGGADALDLDLEELGYEKLLGRGNVSVPLAVKIPEYSSRALEKIEAAGGRIVEIE
jgi:large subunit ribosomal protein L15